MGSGPRIRVGCCGFSTARSIYFRTLPVVEIQQTFYQPPQPCTIEGWRAEAPDGFEFTLKAWQLITHEASSPTYRRLKQRLRDIDRPKVGSFRWTDLTQRAWQTTREAARLLNARKVVFQCPASFRPTDENKDRMREFFSRIPRLNLTCIWEPRGTWLDDDIRALCEELDLIHCVDAFKASPATVPQKGSELRYYRLHGPTGKSASYSDPELKWLAGLAAETEGHAYFMFNNIRMFEDARRFQEMLAEGLEPAAGPQPVVE